MKKIENKFKFDCRYFIFDKPCNFHKEFSCTCVNCKRYKKIVYNILVVKLDSLGDVLRTTAILAPIHKRYPGASVTWVTRRNAVSLFENNPMVDRVLSVEDFQTTFIILMERFDIVFSIDANYNSMLIASSAEARRRRGFFITADKKIKIYPEDNKYAHLWLEMGLNDILKKKNKLTYQEIILNILGLPKDNYNIFLRLSPDEIGEGKRFLKEQGIKKKRHIIIGINPGAGNRWITKRWPPKNYVLLIKHMAQKYKNIRFFLYGGESDREIVEGIAREATDYVINTGVNEMRRFFALLNLVDLLITGDTLALHVALALNKKVIALFGPTSSSEVYLYGQGKKLCSSVPCITCYRSTCNNDFKCMENISVAIVINSIEGLLEESHLKLIKR